jgi:hypothetical protein
VKPGTNADRQEFLEYHSMKKKRVVVIRLILSGIFAVVISRVFFDDMSAAKVVGLGVALFGFAYLFEYVRNRNKEGDAQ